MDFYRIAERDTKSGREVYPDFVVARSEDLMIRGGSFYAIWDESKGLWSTDEYDVARIVDQELYAYSAEREKAVGAMRVRSMRSAESMSWANYRTHVGRVADNSHQLDERLTFVDTKVEKKHYVSRRLPYSLERGDISAYTELFGTLYAPDELAKLEWALGAVVSGDSRNIQKFLVLYGEAGTGKSTWLNMVQQMFEGYYCVFEAKALTSNSSAFSTEAFRSNPLVAIQHDGDLSRIEDNTRLNSIVSHEQIPINEKYKASYPMRVNAMLFMGTNKPVKITDAKSGVLRRLIDVHPTGETVSPARYAALTSQLSFEIGAIAQHCLDVYREMGKNYYSSYLPLEMMIQTDTFYNFMVAYFDVFRDQDGTTLKQAYDLYKLFCDESSMEFKMPRHRFAAELRNYFDGFRDRVNIDGTEHRSWYHGFRTIKFMSTITPDEHVPALVLDQTDSILDTILAEQPAQYASGHETPLRKWIDVSTTLHDIDTHDLHYVKPGEQHIVIDFDLTDDDGNKSLERNLEAASKWPPTYAEFSKGGNGIHLHYIYDGDANELSRVYSEGIEIKVFTGDSSLRRRLSKCNNVPIAMIHDGLPLREKRLLDVDTIQSEKALRALIRKNLRKEIHPGTRPSIQFISKILDDAYKSGLVYDVTDLRNSIMVFANNSTNHADYCLKMVLEMKFASEDQDAPQPANTDDDRLVMYDVEVFPNLFVVCWKFRGSDNVVKLLNPSPQDIEALVRMKLVGFNNRRYDNHIMYARMLGYNLMQLYELSRRIIVDGDRNAMFGEAYNLSWADIYDFSSKKQGLKRFQIELDLNHKELGLPWDEPVPPEKWEEVLEYCANDVVTQEAVFENRYQDYVARQILADLSGLTINDTTQKHTGRIIFGENRKPQGEFVYTDLSETFPGYKYEFGKSYYRDEVVGEGGYVYAEPGMYTQVAVLDVASMHPTTIELLDAFGPYTPNFAALKAARVAIKRKDYDSAKRMLDGKLERYLGSPEDAKALSDALKIVINIVYGLTSASFENLFRDPRNVDNIVAKRGALFMIDLKLAVQERGFQVVHIKTDSIKIPNATPEIIEFVTKFGEKYGYEFEHEVTYEKFCLVNEAVYIAKKQDGAWAATGAQFAHPYVFKTLFSREPIEFNDYSETKSVTTALYLDFTGGDPQFVGRAGAFVPVREGTGGGTLLRGKDDVFHAATGTKGYFWKETQVVKELGLEEDIDDKYFTRLTDEAVAAISKFGDFEWFTS